jgi:ubiquinone/menaquinone biosynthesis C-methylase UbiE
MTAPGDRVHPAARAFGDVADRYERSRPSYPEEAVRHLASVLGIGPGRRVLELGTGTGKFTRQLLPTGATIVAVEPSEGMRAVFHAKLPDVELVDGTAEAIPVPDGSVDVVVAAQSFHWFRQPDTLHEIARIVRPGGGLGMLWNLRDVRAPWVAAFGEVLDPYETSNVPRTQHEGWKAAFANHPAFPPPELAEFSTEQTGDVELFVDRALSVSFAASRPEAERERIAAAVRALLATHPDTRGRSTFTMPYRTTVYWCHRRPD